MNIYDIDGVFVDLSQRLDQQAIDLAAQLMQSRPSIFITGREYEFLIRTFLPCLARAMKTHSVSDDTLYVGAEYGAVRVQKLGDAWTSVIAPEAIAALTAMKQVRPFVEQVAQKYGLTFHHTKKVIATISLNVLPEEQKERAITLGMFEKVHQELMHMVRDTPGIELHRTTKALDIIPAGMDKGYGVTQALNHFARPTHVHIFGDATGDLPLARPIIENHIPYTFWFVGDSAHLSNIDTDGLNLQLDYCGEYTVGTRHILNRLLEREKSQ